MKYKSLYLIAVVVALFSCKKESDDTVWNEQGLNKWVYDNMAKYYLWSSSMPEAENTDSSLSPEKYMEKYLRFRHDRTISSYKDDTYGDRFSSVINKTAKTRTLSAAGEHADTERINSFGIELRSVLVNDKYNYYQVLYVIPGSGAEKSGVKRGDCFRKINGKLISKSFDDETKGLSRIDVEFFFPKKYTVTLAKQQMLNKPVIFDTIYDRYGPKTGYMVYTHFTEGEKGVFNEDMKRVFGKFTAAGIRNLIVDLRYNGGGELSAARFLGSLMARKADLGKVMMYLERNESFGDKEQFSPESFMTVAEVGNYNPDVENIYVLTSEYTASASELIIHSLKPYFRGNLKVVGWKTHGKNIGGITMSSKKHPWELTVMTIRIYDRDKVSGYETGIGADYALKEYYDVPGIPGLIAIGQFGDPHNEAILNKTMSLIYPGAGFDTQGRGIVPVRNDDGIRYGMETTLPEGGLTEGRYYAD